MCDPLTIASTAASVGGSLIQGNEAANNAAAVINARNAATQAEMKRQKGYGDQTRALFDTSVGNFSPENQTAQLESSQNNARDLIGGNAPTATQVGSISSGNAPAVVGTRENTKLGSVFARNAMLDNALGTLKGYDENNLTNKLNLNQSGRDIDMIGDFAKTSAGVNQLEQRAAANNASKRPSPLGSILQTAGNIGSFYAGKGGLPTTSIFGNGVGGTGFSTVRTGGLY